MKYVINENVSRDFERSQAIARAKIALHHWTRFTGAIPPLQRLLTGLERRKIIARRLSCRS